MIKVVTAIEEDYSIDTQSINKKAFIAGGISNCPDWQSEFIEKFKEYSKEIISMIDVTLFNPRRPNFPIDDPKASEEQICWEYKHLKEADIIIFWFSRGTVNPITLYELGRWGNSQLDSKKIIIGIDPLYEKEHSVRIQSMLDDPWIDIYYSLDEVVEQLTALLG